MPNAVKVAISLPPILFESIEQERARRQEGRSEFFRQALEAFLQSLEERAAVKRYVQGYRMQPEEVDEPGTVRAGLKTLATEPWD